MAIRLIRENVERVVNDDAAAQKLEAVGYKRIKAKAPAKPKAKKDEK